jgi:hypothetical protein
MGSRACTCCWFLVFGFAATFALLKIAACGVLLVDMVWSMMTRSAIVIFACDAEDTAAGQDSGGCCSREFALVQQGEDAYGGGLVFGVAAGVAMPSRKGASLSKMCKPEMP